MYRSGHSGAHQHIQAVHQQGTAGGQHLLTRPRHRVGVTMGVVECTLAQNISRLSKVSEKFPLICKIYFIFTKGEFCAVCPLTSPASWTLCTGSAVVMWSDVTVDVLSQIRDVYGTEHLASLLNKLQISQLSAYSQQNIWRPASC